MSVIAAWYETECNNCDHVIRRGETLKVEDGHWVHVTCPPPRKSGTCPSCFLEISLSGACGCPQ